jgi:hypothetical protein
MVPMGCRPITLVILLNHEALADKVGVGLGLVAAAVAVHHWVVRKVLVEEAKVSMVHKASMVVRKASVRKVMVLHHGLVHLCRVHIRIPHLPIQRWCLPTLATCHFNSCQVPFGLQPVLVPNSIPQVLAWQACRVAWGIIPHGMVEEAYHLVAPLVAPLSVQALSNARRRNFQNIGTDLMGGTFMIKISFVLVPGLIVGVVIILPRIIFDWALLQMVLFWSHF